MKIMANELTRWAGMAVGLWIAVSLALVACGGDDEPPAPPVVRPVKTLVLGEGGGLVFRTYPGKVEAADTVDLSFSVSGPMVELPVTEGMGVVKGDLLAQIRTDDFVSDLKLAQSALSQTQAQLKAMKKGAREEDIKFLEAQLASAQAKHVEAELNFERYRKLLAETVISKAEFDKYESAFEVAKAEMHQSEQNLEKGQAGAREEDIEATEAQINGLKAQVETARLRLNDTSLRAPFDGKIVKTFVDNFQEVQAKQVVIRLSDASEMDVVIYIPEAVVAQAPQTYKTMAEAAGAIHAKVRFPSIPDHEFKITPKAFQTEADLITQTYEARFLLPKPEGVNIMPGMTATVDVEERLFKGGPVGGGDEIFVPTGAVIGDAQGGKYVWRIDPVAMTVHRVDVVVGELAPNATLHVLEGLSAGEMIAISGVHHLREGLKVRSLDGVKGR